MRLVACVLVLSPTLAFGEVAATGDLSLKIGEGRHSEGGEDRSLFVSAIVGAKYAALPWLDVAVDLAATKATADWEEVSGLANAAVSATAHGTRDAVRWQVGAGVTIPLATVGTIRDFPMDFEGDSLVYSATTEDEDTWDYSAYRRAAMNRGAWNLWMWAPDWVTAFIPARVQTDLAPAITGALDGALATAFAIGDGHDRGEVAVVAQAAVDVAWHANARSRLGMRVLDVIVFHDDLSPHLTSVEGYFGWRSGRTDLRIRLTVPVRDHRHPNAPDGMSGFRAYEEWGLNTALAVGF
jgi:hypothetical protein